MGNQEAQQLVLSKTGSIAVPVIEINNKFIIGFNRKEIDRAIQ